MYSVRFLNYLPPTPPLWKFKVTCWSHQTSPLQVPAFEAHGSEFTLQAWCPVCAGSPRWGPPALGTRLTRLWRSWLWVVCLYGQKQKDQTLVTVPLTLSKPLWSKPGVWQVLAGAVPLCSHWKRVLSHSNSGAIDGNSGLWTGSQIRRHVETVLIKRNEISKKKWVLQT